jgi:acyl-CoA reductase-like NAD-dependent aldehyde dehydrogenase
MNVSDNQINAIVDRVVQQLTCGEVPVLPDPPVRTPSTPEPQAGNLPGHHPDGQRPNAAATFAQTNGRRGCFPDINSAVDAARKAFYEFSSVSIEQRKRIVQAIREICLDHVKELAHKAVEETGLGRVDDKIIKNTLVITKTPGVEDVEPRAFTGDHGLALEEYAPFGVIGSITPTTNPSETIINNGIGMIAGGNTVAFNPHPSAKDLSIYTINLMNTAVLSEDGPANLFTTVETPTIQSAQALMKHTDVRLLVVTGGPAVVRAAMNSGKRVIAAGPGNPPVVVDETADLAKAAKDTVTSASCDNNIICVVEKEIIATEKAAPGLKKELLRHGAIELSPYQAKRLEQVILTQDGHPNKKFVGKNIQVILSQIGMDVDPNIRMAFVETGADHPFATEELMMPVLPLIRARDVENAIELAYKLERGCFHTAVIHSKNIDNMHRMALRMNTSILVKNGSSLAGLGYGGEGHTSFTIASPTGEGMTTARHFTRARRCTLSGYFRIV